MKQATSIKLKLMVLAGLVFATQSESALYRQVQDENGNVLRKEGDAPVADAKVNLAYDMMGTMNQFWKENRTWSCPSQLGCDGWNGANAPMIVQIGPETGKYAIWDKSEKMVIVDSRDVITQEVMAHEWTHAFIEGQGPKFLNRTLHEGFADIYGAWGEKDWIANDGAPEGTRRDLRNPVQNLNADYYGMAWDELGSVYVNSTLISHLFYLYVQGGFKNGYAISGQGWDKGIQLFHKVLVNGSLNSDSKIANVYEALRSTVVAMYGYGSEALALNQSLSAMGFWSSNDQSIKPIEQMLFDQTFNWALPSSVSVAYLSEAPISSLATWFKTSRQSVQFSMPSTGSWFEIKGPEIPMPLISSGIATNAQLDVNLQVDAPSTSTGSTGMGYYFGNVQFYLGGDYIGQAEVWCAGPYKCNQNTRYSLFVNQALAQKWQGSEGSTAKQLEIKISGNYWRNRKLTIRDAKINFRNYRELPVVDCSNIATAGKANSSGPFKQLINRVDRESGLTAYKFECRKGVTDDWCRSPAYQPLAEPEGVNRIDQYWPAAFDLVAKCQ
jgi:hypothetical protein